MRHAKRLAKKGCWLSLAVGSLLAAVAHLDLLFKSNDPGKPGLHEDTALVTAREGLLPPREQPGPEKAATQYHDYWPGAVWREMRWIWDDGDQFRASSRKIKILYWTAQYQNPVWFGLGNDPFVKAHCPIRNCETTNDTSTFASSDALLIHQAALKKVSLPTTKPPGQKWVLNMAESPVYDTESWDALKGLFEGIADYRIDADIPRLPGYFATKLKGTPPENVDYSKGKDQRPPVAWFVSHCQTQSLRQAYVDELRKHIEIDVYGRCGKMVCKRPKSDHSPLNDPCMNMLHREYKFYLAFENSLCRDYITEKLWLIYVHQMNIVPIVLGGSNYSRFLPPQSYIDILDFQSPRHLANHLRLVSSNPDLYNAYFAWRKKYHFKKAHTLPCGICTYLHKTLGKSVVHKDLQEWKSKQKHCVNPRAYYGSRLFKAHK